ncbi:unnamed protein product [Coregonus sp. 'balchen']|nr:unnamed protein product [Coregonus sp. 'balchen']
MLNLLGCESGLRMYPCGIPHLTFDLSTPFDRCPPSLLQDNGEDAHRIAPSPVVHVRGLCESVVEGDLVEALEKFGNICYVMMMPFKRQALVEFEAMESADQCVTCGTNEAVNIAGQQAFFNYSTSKRITRPTNADDPNSGNKVLLLSIQNPLYPITTKAKSALNGADIYAGSCTLKIEYAREVVAYPLPQTSSYMGHASSSSVAMVSGLHPAKMNCTRIFNLFCLYGNIEKVKFMKSVPGTALVEMGDEYAVDRSITHLNSIKVFSKRLNVFELEDGSSSYKDFAMTRNNRFSSVGQASKNIIQPPAAVLHFYNVPPCITEDELQRLCTEHDVPSFIKFKVFDAKPSSKTISGLFEFDNKTHAVEVLTVLNHHQIRIPSKYCVLLRNGSNPYTLKLCFSTSSHL